MFKHDQLSAFIEVQPRRKVLPYTISLIGDSKALGDWKLAQAAQEMAYQKAQEPIRAARRAQAVGAVEAQDGRRTEANSALQKQAKEELIQRLVAKGKIKALLEMTPVHVPTPKSSVLEKAFNWIKSILS